MKFSMRKSLISTASVFLLLFLAHVPVRALTRLVDAVAVLEPATDGSTTGNLDVKLPFSWDTAQGAVDGKARLLLTFPATDLAAPSALLTRIGNTYEVSLNGVSIAAAGEPWNRYQDFGKEPLFIRIPANVLQAENRLEITLHALGQRHAGVTPIVFGPAHEVYAQYKEVYRIRIAAAFAIGVISLALGTLALLLWIRQRDGFYLYYGIGELLWVLHISDTVFSSAPLPWPWWGICVFSAYLMAGLFICKFSLAMVDAHRGAIKIVTTALLLLTVPVAAFVLIANLPKAWMAWQGLTVATFAWTGSLVVWYGFRSGDIEKRVLATAAALTASTALRDFVVIKLMPDAFGQAAWVRFAWLLYAITLAWVIAERLRKSTQSLSRANATLSARLAEREAELSAIFSRQIEADRQRATAEERQRLTRDMHDGIGSQIAGALLLAQDPASPRDVLTEQLREALDHLRLTVDAMQDSEGDIASILGALRYRLGPRLHACNIDLVWNVQELPQARGWTIQHARHLQLILFEAFSNLMTHARATRAELSASRHSGVDTDTLRIVLSDNGSGFDVGHTGSEGGQGLSNMRARAAQIGAFLEVKSGQGGTHIMLELHLVEEPSPP